MPDIETMGQMILAAGALGTASFGLVEAAKWSRLGEAGFPEIRRLLGPVLTGPLVVAYGPRVDELLRAQFRKDRQEHEELARTLRQGGRIGLTPGNAEELADFLGVVKPEALRAAAKTAQSGGELNDQDRNTLARFELALDTRIEAALALARDHYIGMVRVAASFVAVALALVAAAILEPDGISCRDHWLKAFLLGIAAVPLAPIANDLVGALNAASKALKARA